MAYLSTIPQPTDQKNISQAQILENFAQIYTVFSVDHSTFDSPLGQGTHAKATFPVNTAVTRPANNQMRMYADTGTSGNPELYLWNGATNSNVEITTSSQNSNGYTTTPAGVLIKWGSATINNAATGQPQTWTWPSTATDIPFTQQLWAIVQVGATTGSPNADVNAVAYVVNISNPLIVNYNIWRRNLFSTPGTNQFPFTVWILAIGVP